MISLIGFPLLIKRNSSNQIKSIWSPDLKHDFYESSDNGYLNIINLEQRIIEYVKNLQNENIRFNYPKKLRDYKTNDFNNSSEEWIKISAKIDIKVKFFEKALPRIAVLLFLLTALGSAILTGMSISVTSLGGSTETLAIFSICLSLSAYLLVYLFSNTTSDYKKYGRTIDNLSLIEKQDDTVNNVNNITYQNKKKNCMHSTIKILTATTLTTIVIGDSISTGIKIYQEMVALGELGNKENKLLISSEATKILASFFGFVTVLSMLGFDASFANIAYDYINKKLEHSFKEFTKKIDTNEVEENHTELTPIYTPDVFINSSQSQEEEKKEIIEKGYSQQRVTFNL